MNSKPFSAASDSNIAAEYLRDNFKPDHRLAVVLIEKRAGAVL